MVIDFFIYLKFISKNLSTFKKIYKDKNSYFASGGGLGQAFLASPPDLEQEKAD